MEMTIVKNWFYLYLYGYTTCGTTFVEYPRRISPSIRLTSIVLSAVRRAQWRLTRPTRTDVYTRTQKPYAKGIVFDNRKASLPRLCAGVAAAAAAFIIYTIYVYTAVRKSSLKGPRPGHRTNQKRAIIEVVLSRLTFTQARPYSVPE